MTGAEAATLLADIRIARDYLLRGEGCATVKYSQMLEIWQRLGISQVPLMRDLQSVAVEVTK